MLLGKHVLEIGCNAGMQIYDIMRYARLYTGLEPDAHYYNQLGHTVEFLYKAPQNISLRSCKLADYLQPYQQIPDAFFGSNILYWLSDHELHLLRTIVLPKCDRVVVLTRMKERSVEKNSFKLNRDFNVATFFITLGFRVKIHRLPLHKVGKHYQGGYFVVTGERYD
jgi:hypothetical protein